METDVAKWILGAVASIEPARQFAITQYEKRKQKKLDKAKEVKKLKKGN